MCGAEESPRCALSTALIKARPREPKLIQEPKGRRLLFPWGGLFRIGVLRCACSRLKQWRLHLWRAKVASVRSQHCPN
mgnify:CR=1 FL=1